MGPNQLCAGGEKGKGSCQGDSGGGLFMRKGENGADGDMESPWYLGLFLMDSLLVGWGYQMFTQECQNMSTGYK